MLDVLLLTDALLELTTGTLVEGRLVELELVTTEVTAARAAPVIGVVVVYTGR